MQQTPGSHAVRRLTGLVTALYLPGDQRIRRTEMTTITADGIRSKGESKRGFFARALDRVMEAQMYRARATAKPHLLVMDDEELRRLGYTRAEIERWPSGALWL
jgi:hypothetical protein